MKKLGDESVRAPAVRLGYTLKYVYDLLYAGRLIGATKIGRRWLIPSTTVERLVKEREARNGQS